METRELWEITSYVITVIGLPFAIVVFILEQRKERRNEQEEIFQRLSDEYREFLKLVLDHSDLHLMRSDGIGQDLTDEQKERRFVIFGILVSLFERAYLLVYEKHMDKQTRRLWQSWEDYMREWMPRSEFRAALPQLLDGEDPEFTAHIKALAAEEESRIGSAAAKQGVAANAQPVHARRDDTRLAVDGQTGPICGRQAG